MTGKINQNEQIMQNKANFLKSQIFITVISTKSYNEKCELDTWLKRTQTNPIYSELVEPISKWRKPPPTAGTLAQEFFLFITKLELIA